MAKAVIVFAALIALYAFGIWLHVTIDSPPLRRTLEFIGAAIPAAVLFGVRMMMLKARRRSTLEIMVRIAADTDD